MATNQTLNQLKNFDADSYDLDALIALSADGKALRNEFTALGVDVPEWLESTIRLISKTVDLRQADALEKRARTIRARIQALKPASERRLELDAELKAVEAKLGK